MNIRFGWTIALLASLALSYAPLAAQESGPPTHEPNKQREVASLLQQPEEKPSKTEKEAKPPKAGKEEKPPKAEKEAKPPKAGKEEKPPKAEKEGKPPKAGNEEKPSKTEKEGKPPKAGNEEKPSKTEKEGKPPKAGNEEKPSKTEKGQKSAAAQQEKARPTGKSAHIPDPQFKAHFGKQHTFAVNRVVTTTTIVPNQTQFVYSGYTFTFLDPWPADWLFADDCYIDYVDDEYFLFDVFHPGIRVALFVVG